MPPEVIIGAASAAIALLEQLAPLIQSAVKGGEISPEVQAQLNAKVEALRPGGTAFAGPEWAPSK